MWEAVLLYARYVGISLRAQMQYRVSFLFLLLGNLLGSFVEFVGIVALFSRFGSLKGWHLEEIALFYGIVGSAFALAEGLGRGFDTFGDLVKSGDFDRLLLRPRSTALQVAAMEVQLMRIGRLAQAFVVLLWAICHQPAIWSSSRLLLVLFSIVGGACLFYGLLVLQATLSFWTVEGLEVMNTVTYGGIEVAQYPLSIYPGWFRSFFTFVVPLACINYLPSRVLLPYAPLGSDRWPDWVAWMAPLIGVGFLLIALQVWQFGVRRYRSTGS